MPLVRISLTAIVSVLTRRVSELAGLNLMELVRDMNMILVSDEFD